MQKEGLAVRGWDQEERTRKGKQASGKAECPKPISDLETPPPTSERRDASQHQDQEPVSRVSNTARIPDLEVSHSHLSLCRGVVLSHTGCMTLAAAQK